MPGNGLRRNAQCGQGRGMVSLGMLKELLRSLLIPGKPPPAPARPAAKKKVAAKAPRTAPVKGGTDWNHALDGSHAGQMMREMLRQKLQDPEFAKAFAQGIKKLLHKP